MSCEQAKDWEEQDEEAERHEIQQGDAANGPGQCAVSDYRDYLLRFARIISEQALLSRANGRLEAIS